MFEVDAGFQVGEQGVSWGAGPAATATATASGEKENTDGDRDRRETSDLDHALDLVVWTGDD